MALGIDNDMNMLIDSHEGNVYEENARVLIKERCNADTAPAKKKQTVRPSIYSSRLPPAFGLFLQHMLFNSSTL